MGAMQEHFQECIQPSYTMCEEEIPPRHCLMARVLAVIDLIFFLSLCFLPLPHTLFSLVFVTLFFSNKIQWGLRPLLFPQKKTT